MNWHIITCEYPPQSGGVSDYTKLVAQGLAEAGDEVHVWAPAEQEAGGRRQEAEPGRQAAEGRQELDGRRQDAEGRKQEADGKRQTADSALSTQHSSRVTVHRELGRFRPNDLRRVGKQLDQFTKPRRLLVQWVPHGYGFRSMNLPFCFWLWRRAKLKGDRVDLMVHEPFLAFREGSKKQELAAGIHRLMIVLLLIAASRIWISTQEWEKHLRPFLFGRKKEFGWLPVPSTIPLVDDPDGVSNVRAKYATNGTNLVGHFGAYNDYMADAMSKLLPSILNGENNLSMLLLGKGSSELRDRLSASYPHLSGKVHATGELAPDDLSKHVSACDVMLQPYQDGVSGRRTSVMTALEHGMPVITNRGKATEACWSGNQCILLEPNNDLTMFAQATRALAADEAARTNLGLLAREFYKQRFSLSVTVSRLQSQVGVKCE